MYFLEIDDCWEGTNIIQTFNPQKIINSNAVIQLQVGVQNSLRGIIVEVHWGPFHQIKFDVCSEKQVLLAVNPQWKNRELYLIYRHRDGCQQ